MADRFDPRQRSPWPYVERATSYITLPGWLPATYGATDPAPTVYPLPQPKSQQLCRPEMTRARKKRSKRLVTRKELAVVVGFLGRPGLEAQGLVLLGFGV